MPMEKAQAPHAQTIAYLCAICVLAIHLLAFSSPDVLPNAELLSMSRFPDQAHLVLEGGDAFVPRGDGFICTDIDECALNTDGCIHSLCFNKLGAYECGQYDAGYSGYGKDCVPDCGDGLIVSPEGCHDGNLSDCDFYGANWRPMNIFSAGPNLLLPMLDGAFAGNTFSMVCASITGPPLSGNAQVQRLCVETGITHPGHLQLILGPTHPLHSGIVSSHAI